MLIAKVSRLGALSTCALQYQRGSIAYLLGGILVALTLKDAHLKKQEQPCIGYAETGIKIFQPIRLNTVN